MCNLLQGLDVNRGLDSRKRAFPVWIGALCALVAFLSRSSPAWAEDAIPGPSPAVLPADAAVQAMGICLGATVLEISPGRNSLAFPLARAVGASGTVVAAAFDARTVQKLAETANSAELPQIKAILLAKSWDPAFYADQRFDAAIFNDVLEKMADPRRELAGFRRILGQTGGRLFVLRRDFLPEFDETMILDPNAIFSILQGFGDDSPFHARLPDDLRTQIGAAPPASDTGSVARLVVFLNRCLNDPGLYADVARFYAAKTGIGSEFMSELPDLKDAMLVCALVHNYDRAFEAGAAPETPQQKLAVYTVNHMLLTGIFRLPRRAPFYADPGAYCPDRDLPALFAQAGFKMAEKTAFPPNFTLWEFRPDAAAAPAESAPP